MDKPERSSYNAVDFIGWRRLKSLEISPKFQRRPVWNRAARSYLIDTLILGFPVPPLFIRVTQSEDGSRSIREVIDGQQRMRAVLEFIDGGYSLAQSIKSPYGNMRFDELPEEVKNKIKFYSFITEVFYGISDEDVLQTFARLNTNSVRLNAQELRNGKFFGQFKETIYSLALNHLTFWRNNRIFSERGIARMQEAELTSELVILMMAGMQDKKKSINDYYEKYDESLPNRDNLIRRFQNTIDNITSSIGDTIKESEFRRTPLFYSLFAAMYDRLYGLHGFAKSVIKGDQLSAADKQKFSDAVVKLSDLVTTYREEETVPRIYQSFVIACLQQTDNIGPRRTRYQTIYKEAFG
jgi:uncharacterized protein with ParB-like and HNH nuclease domain